MTERGTMGPEGGLAERLDAVVEHLAPSQRDELQALLACETVWGPVVIVCWGPDAADLTYQLLDLRDGTPVTERAAVREAFALVAMVETLEDALHQDGLHGPAGALGAWCEHADPAPESVRDAVRALTKALEGLSVPASNPARLATTELLDELSARVRQVEGAAQTAIEAVEQWAPTAEPQAHGLLERFWQIVAMLHRGPLALPAISRAQQGREAGIALAEQVLAAQ